jgi:transmembrane sensor
VKPWFDRNIAARSASRWFARLHAADVSDSTDNAFRRWLSRSTGNEQEFERRELIWELLGELQNDPEVTELTQAASVPNSHGPNRSQPWVRSRWGLAAAVAAAVVGVGYWQSKTPVHESVLAPHEEVFSTKTGEQKRITLTDGSRVELNTATSLRVRFTDRIRLLSLDRGEAVFFVQHDAKRPFEVTAGQTSTRALGTTFNVLQLNNRTDITVLDGHVQVQASSGPFGERRIGLRAGEASTYTGQGGLGPVQPADVARISSWQVQRVEFHDVALADAVDDFNRYSTTPLVIGDSSVRDIRVSGLFRFGDTAAFTYALHSAFGIRSATQGQAVVLLPPASSTHGTN